MIQSPMDMITYADFAKIDFRVGEIIEAIKVEASEKLIKMTVDFGQMGQRIVFSGIYQWYKPEELQGKKTVFVVNMPPKKIMGEVSEAMIFGGMDKEANLMSLVLLDKNLKNGSIVF